MCSHKVSGPVLGRIESLGEDGKKWLEQLNHKIEILEKKWNIQVVESMHGGTEAFVAKVMRGRKEMVLKISLQSNHFEDAVAILEEANGRGLVKLYAYDLEHKAFLLECLGSPLDYTNLNLEEKLSMICTALKQVWMLPCPHPLVSGEESLSWFKDYLLNMWEKLDYPCSFQVIRYAWQCLMRREEKLNSDSWVLLHGDAHGMNALLTTDKTTCRLIDPEGLFYEKAYDLGVLMREWINDYKISPVEAREWRANYLSQLMKVDKNAILDWGFVQTVSTAFVFYQIGKLDQGKEMLRLAKIWSGEKNDYLDALCQKLWLEYGLHVVDIHQAKRGFYGETWIVETPKDKYFVKVDPWTYHHESFENGLRVVDELYGQGIDFVPRVVWSRSGNPWSFVHHKMIGVFEYIVGKNSDSCSYDLVYSHLNMVYDLKSGFSKVPKENFLATKAILFQTLRVDPRLPSIVFQKLKEKEEQLMHYAKRLVYFSKRCQNKKTPFVLTHGDAGGNCILDDNKVFIVDWDTAMWAPVERDTWIYMNDLPLLDELTTKFSLPGGKDMDFLCFYCYDFFFHYLNEYLKNICNTQDPERIQYISDGVIDYLTESWINQRLEIADRIG